MNQITQCFYFIPVAHSPTILGDDLHYFRFEGFELPPIKPLDEIEFLGPFIEMILTLLPEELSMEI
jgi:hypothetical protein